MQVLKMITILVLGQLLLMGNDKFIPVQNEKISIQANKDVYENDDHQEFHISTIKSGYISIIYIAENGTIGFVKENVWCNRSYDAPDATDEFEYIATNLSAFPTSEIYIAIFSDDKIIDFKLIKELSKGNYRGKVLTHLLRKYKDYAAIQVVLKNVDKEIR